MKAYCINLNERPERWEVFSKQVFPFDVQRVEGVKASPGWKGCTQSHLKVLEGITEFPSVVFEDDCLMLASWDKVEEIMKQLPDNWDMFYLGANLNEKLERYSDNLYRIKNAWCTHAIIYNSQRAIDHILNNRDGMRKIDVFLIDNILPNYECFISYPLLATQRPGHSDIINKYTDYNLISKNYHKFVK